MQLIQLHTPFADKPEKFKSLRLTAKTAYKKYSLITVPVKGIEVGDLFDIRADFQVTSEHVFHVMVASGVCVGTTPEDTDGIWALKKNGTNINGKIHHYVRTRTGWWKAVEAVAQLYFNLVVYAASTDAKTPNAIAVDQGYGSMSVAQYR